VFKGLRLAQCPQTKKVESLCCFTLPHTSLHTLQNH